MDKSRQQFEEFIMNKPQAHIDPLKMSEFGYYYYHVTREAWDAWQASRESLEVELPVTSIFEIGSAYDSGYHNGVKECKEILISNGVKIK